jgi:deoxyribodipyrimidine photolyase-related protein
MTIGIWILGDRLALNQTTLQSCVDLKSSTSVILIESLNHVRLRPYHQQKLVLVWSAMRHFAKELEQDGWNVNYEIADDFESTLIDWIQIQGITELRIMTPADRPFRKLIDSLDLPCKIVLFPDNHFLWTTEEFAEWAKGRKSLLLEYFYRAGRQKFQVLMDGDKPIGGKWNLDKENRKPPKGGLKPPPPLLFTPDEITRQVMAKVSGLNIRTYGKLDSFGWAVTRTEALAVLADFIDARLPTFGPYQDAMVTGQTTMWHALLSPYLNLGLLHPLEVIRAVETAYRERKLDLNSIEGLIRQILGWREYMYGIYHHVEDDYFQLNWFGHDRPLPDFFWDASKAKMNCLRQTLTQIEDSGYGHHIQRLMILSNFALIAGLNPQAVENWFHATFIDAYDWVMQMNVLGMGLFADGGMLASKPYAASANYINKMSDYCSGCQYSLKERTGEKACPFNFFYWDFLARHRDRLQSQGRMALILKNLDRISPEELETIHQKATNWHGILAGEISPLEDRDRSQL